MSKEWKGNKKSVSTMLGMSTTWNPEQRAAGDYTTMKKIGLIDVDHHNFPNIALMKISNWHKQLGNSVEWYTPFEHYNIVYVSKVFSFSEDWREPINADIVIRGGTGYQIELRKGKEIYQEIPLLRFKELFSMSEKYVVDMIYPLEG